MSFDNELYENRTHTGYGSVSVHRSSSVKRKDAARKSLLGTINTRLVDVRHSSSRMQSEPCRHDIKFPRVNMKDRTARGSGHTHVKSDYRSINSELSSPGAHSESADDKRSRGVIVSQSRFVRNTSGKNVSLPEIIMEFNIETSMVTNGDRHEFSRSTPEALDERALGAPYEEFLRRPKNNIYNPCRAKYRPVTPGLLDSLNKLKMPTKAKTEQWLKSTQYSEKTRCGHAYKTEQLDNSNLSFPNWIYSYMDT